MENYRVEKEEIESKMEAMLEEMEETRTAQRAQLNTFDRLRIVDINRFGNHHHPHPYHCKIKADSVLSSYRVAKNDGLPLQRVNKNYGVRV